MFFYLAAGIALTMPLLAFISLILTVFSEKKRLKKVGTIILETLGVFGLTFIFFFISETGNNCCGESAAFSPEHRLSVLVIVGSCMAAYYLTMNRSIIAAPLLEVIYNVLLVLGVVFNLILLFHLDLEYWFLGCFSIICFFIIRLIQNFRLIKAELNLELYSDSALDNMAKSILKLNAWNQYPIILILVIPLLMVIACILLLFGQEPDSLIKAFTDTYKHGFSQLDYQCDNVECGGHYLCSVAAQGHTNVVKPIRYGHRNGGLIICNRQLLISNAFEEMILEKLPRSHRVIRRNYDKVGDVVKSHYHLFSIKWISDLVYIFMKPLEWIFLISLYLFVRNPESKIAKQYLQKG